MRQINLTSPIGLPIVSAVSSPRAAISFGCGTTAPYPSFRVLQTWALGLLHHFSARSPVCTTVSLSLSHPCFSPFVHKHRCFWSVPHPRHGTLLHRGFAAGRIHRLLRAPSGPQHQSPAGPARTVSAGYRYLACHRSAGSYSRGYDIGSQPLFRSHGSCVLGRWRHFAPEWLGIAPTHSELQPTDHGCRPEHRDNRPLHI